jgi:3-methyladenine DNA glycosylase AlkD
MPRHETTPERVRAKLVEMGTADRKGVIARFFKEPVVSLGVDSPSLKRCASEIHREVKTWDPTDRERLCTGLWEGGELETGMLATYVYARFAPTFGEPEFLLFEGWLKRHADNWAHVDALCCSLIAPCLAAQPHLAPRVRTWVGSRNRWVRRGASVALVKEVRAGRQVELAFVVAEDLRGDPDVMVQKGVGWMLKEAYAKHPSEVVEFLVSRPKPFSRLVLRYAAEKMSPPDRARVLG